MRKPVATTIGVAVVATVAGGALAIASNMRVSGTQAARAARTAIEAAGGEWATLASPEGGVARKFQVMRIDGSRVEVLLDDQFRVVSVGDENVFAQAPAADADRAAQAALKATGGGSDDADDKTGDRDDRDDT